MKKIMLLLALFIVISCPYSEIEKKDNHSSEHKISVVEQKYINLKKAVIKNDPSVLNISDQYELAKFLMNHVFQNITLGKTENESNLIKQYELIYAKNLVEFYNYYYKNSNDGHACWGLAYMFSMICEAFEIPSRFVALCDNIIDDDYNSHATVECYINEKWIICDPTFNVVCRYNNALIGYEEMYNLCKEGLSYQIKWERCGFVPENRYIENSKYIETYYVPITNWQYVAFQKAKVLDKYNNIITLERKTLPESWDMSCRNGTKFFGTYYDTYFHYFSMGEFRLNK